MNRFLQSLRELQFQTERPTPDQFKLLVSNQRTGTQIKSIQGENRVCKGVYRVFTGCVRVFTGCLQGVYGCLQGVYRVCKGVYRCIQGVSGCLHGAYKVCQGVCRVYTWYVRVFTGCIQGV